MRNLSTIVLLVLALAAAGPAAAAGADADWPCQQRKVPELSAGLVWAGPQREPGAPGWRSDAAVFALVERLAVRRTSLEAASELIAAFADGLAGAARQEMITLAFFGLLDRVNAERKDVLEGIERYTRKQRRLADEILQTRQQLNAVLAVEAPSSADDERRRELEERLTWQTRIHEERERSLGFVCEIPVLIEQRLFALARELANHLE
jgi:hypothetical protein